MGDGEDGEENKTRKIPKSSESRVLPCLAFFNYLHGIKYLVASSRLRV